jgi:signal transduction histidine kinase
MVIVILLALSIITYLWYRNYLRAREANKQLALKNDVIEKHSLALETLNKAITHQNESLEEANLMKNKLLSILSHDLRGPLSNTQGILQLINNGVLEPAQFKPVFKELEKQYVRSIALLENLLFWIKSQMQGNPIVPKEVNLKSLLDKLIEEQDAALQNKGITVTNDVAPELNVVGDHEMLKVIFRNLLSNSVKFTRKEGNVAVSAAIAEEVLIKIKDQGIGISEETLKKIRRKRYFTTAGTANEGGSGFGLMICEELISRHGGELIVESEVNEGSLFAVKFPAHMLN